MPAPVVYVFAVVGTIGAALAFKEFVYEPHIAPRIEQWATEFIAKREAKRRMRMGPMAMSGDGTSTGVNVVELQLRRRRPGRRNTQRSESDSSTDSDEDDADGKSKSNEMRESPRRRRTGADTPMSMKENPEMTDIVAREVREWRSEVDRSTGNLPRPAGAGVLRQRKSGSTSLTSVMDDSIRDIPYTPLSPTHIIFDPSSPTSSTVPSRIPSPPVIVSPLRQSGTSISASSATQSASSDGELVTLPPQEEKPSASFHTLSSAASPSTHTAPAPAPLTNSFTNPNPTPPTSPPPAPVPAPTSVPSLSQIYHPEDLDFERGIELLSPPSSRADSPFSDAYEHADPFSSPSLQDNTLLHTPPARKGNTNSESGTSAAAYYSARSSPSSTSNPFNLSGDNGNVQSQDQYRSPTLSVSRHSNASSSRAGTPFTNISANDTRSPRAASLSAGAQAQGLPTSPRSQLRSPILSDIDFLSDLDMEDGRSDASWGAL